MSNKQVREFLGKLPPGMREKVAGSMNTEAAEKNAAEVAEVLGSTSDAILNLGVIAFSGAHDDDEKALIQRCAALSITTIKALETFVMRMLPDGPKQAAHDMLNRTIASSLPSFDKLMPELLPKGVASRAEALEKKVEAEVARLHEELAKAAASEATTPEERDQQRLDEDSRNAPEVNDAC